MTGIGLSDPGLLLAGYVPLCRFGFALPCYAERTRANECYVAACSPPGDHAGSVAAFEFYDGGGIVWLPENQQRRVRVEDPWLDVFLWDDGARVGTPGELLSLLQPSAADLAACVPISWLDLFLAGSEDDATDLAEAARIHVANRHGPEAGVRWHRDHLLRDQVIITVRRQLAASGISGLAPADLGNVRVDYAATRLGVVLPKSVWAALGTAGALADLDQRLQLVLGRIGVSDVLATSEVPDEAAPADPPPPVRAARDPRVSEKRAWATEPESHGERTPEASGFAVRLLVAFSGNRARMVSRHIKTPDWLPVGFDASGGDWAVRRGKDALSDPSDAICTIDVLSDEQLPSTLEKYHAVVWLLDDDLVLNADPDGIVIRLVGERGGRRRTVHLLAPALPQHQPSRVLTEIALSGSLPFKADCVCDTSLARSPFWTGNPWRALDRRMADLVVGSALACAVDGSVRTELLDRRPRGRVRLGDDVCLLSCATDRVADGRTPGTLGFVSEGSTRWLSRQPDRGEVHEIHVMPISKSAARVRRAWVSLSRPKLDFGLFAEAVVAQARRTDRLRRDGDIEPPAGPSNEEETKLEQTLVPDRIQATLRAPDLVAALQRYRGLPMVVTGEAPTLRTLQAAAGAHVEVVRYTDEGTLQELLAPRAGTMPFGLPREVQLPGLRRLPHNKGIATRGVDPRDILLLPADRSFRDLAEATQSAVSDFMRVYLPRIDAAEEEAWVALPLDTIAAMLAAGGTLESDLRDGLDLNGFQERPYLLKRPSDLHVAWTGPADGARRFVVEDGRLPVEIMELQRGAVPAQRMFIIDGDSAVPLLLGSRIFGLWARATTSRSTSWLSRFSVGGTFETLPIPHEIKVCRDAAGVSLVLRPGTSKLADLAERLDRERGGGSRWPSRYAETNHRAYADAWNDVDAALLLSIGLDPGASDVDVLVRLVEINRDASGRDVGDPTH